MILRAAFLVLALAAGPVLAACPPLPDRGADRAAILANLRNADSYTAGRDAIAAAWGFWRMAPDEAAQELLDTGMRAIRYGDHLRATRTLERLTAYCPDYAEGWNQLAFALFLQHRDDAALAALDQALDLEPAHFGALAGVALIHIRAGRPALGQIWLRKAVAINPWLNERGLLEKSPGSGSEL